MLQFLPIMLRIMLAEKITNYAESNAYIIAASLTRIRIIEVQITEDALYY